MTAPPILFDKGQPVWLQPHGDETRRVPGEVVEVKLRDGRRTHFYVVLIARGRYHAHHTEMAPR